jgi:GH15 family glucan-1,4-alpha-glucosidase
VTPRHDYLPIAEHGVIGDLSTVALVGTDGTIDWYCCPHFDSPSVFASILDRDRGGFYRIAPAAPDWTPKQLYFPDTNVLITRFLSAEGVVEVEDFMPIHTGGEEMRLHRLVRRVLGVRGQMRLLVEVEPRFDYGRASHVTHVTEHGVVFRSPDKAVALEAAVPFERTAQGVRSELILRAEESVTFVLGYVDGDYVPRPYSEEETRATYERTIEYWRRWLSQSRYRGRWREMVHRSALTLKLLTFRPTGAIVAAPTTSLPEQLGGERNWDYRYTWIRDAAFSLYALLRLGFT